MTRDKFSAIWLSHSSISDYLKCPRLYYLRHIYKDPKTGRKITRIQPPLALGQAVHSSIEVLAKLPQEERKVDELFDIYEKNWEKVTGKKGGFKDSKQEKEYKERGKAMLERIIKKPGPILKKAIKIREDLPHYWLSEDDNIILCGKLDWLEYNDEADCVHILDFKTGKHDEDPDSLQLPIYYLLAVNTQTKPVKKAFYWYLDRDDDPVEMTLPDMKDAEKRVLEVTRKIALARKLNHLECKFGKNRCPHCQAIEDIVAGKGEFVGKSDWQDVYII